MKEREIQEHKEKKQRYRQELDSHMEGVIRFRNAQVEGAQVQAHETSLKIPNFYLY